MTKQDEEILDSKTLLEKLEKIGTKSEVPKNIVGLQSHSNNNDDKNEKFL
jgi:hypothetical protein